MGQILQHEHRAKKEGVTLVETVIAIAIVVIVSVAASSVAVYSSNLIHNSSVKRYFQNEVNSVSKLYLEYSGSDFSRAMHDFCADFCEIDETFTDGTYTYHYNHGFDVVTGEAAYDYVLDLTFSDSCNSLAIASRYSDGSAIYSRSLAK